MTTPRLTEMGIPLDWRLMGEARGGAGSAAKNVSRHVSIGTLAAGLLVAASGCGVSGMDDQAVESDGSDVASSKQELNRNNLSISFSDNRTASNVIVTFYGVDNTTGQRHSDWEAVGNSSSPNT